jgi:hypothetical protein
LFNVWPPIPGSQTLFAVVRLFLLIKLPLSLLILEPLPHFNLFLPQKLVHELLRVHALSNNRASEKTGDG